MLVLCADRCVRVLHSPSQLGCWGDDSKFFCDFHRRFLVVSVQFFFCSFSHVVHTSSPLRGKGSPNPSATLMEPQGPDPAVWRWEEIVIRPRVSLCCRVHVCGSGMCTDGGRGRRNACQTASISKSCAVWGRNPSSEGR